MGVFDRFRAQPKWKHADAAVRLAGVEEIGLEDQGLLATLAREDADARVRRAAVRKVYDPAVLKEVAARDHDTEVREEAGAVLLDLAMGAFEDSTEAESLKALEHLEDAKHLAAVAKGANAEAVSLAALSRLTDVKAIGSVARRADHASTRLEALGRVDEAEEIFAIAMKSEYRDVALAAVERLNSREHLKAAAARATQKQVARRARALLRPLEEAEQVETAPAAAEPPPVPPTDWNAERDKARRAAEEIAGERDWRAAETRLAAAEARWAGIERDAPEAGAPEAASRFADACDRVRQAIGRLKQEEAARAERVEQAARQHTERVAACERLEGLAALISRRAAAGSEAGTGGEAIKLEDMPAHLESARRAWAALETPLIAADEIERLDRRFERASAACQREAERCRTFEARRGRLGELVEQAETIAGTASIDRTMWSAAKQEWTDLGGAAAAGARLAARFEVAQSSIARRETEAREQELQRQRETLRRVQQACERLEMVAKSETVTLKDGEHALRDVRTALDAAGSLAKKDRADFIDRLKAVQSTLFPRVQELREADDWVRWANVGIQEDLCRRAEALREVADAAEAARQLHELQEQWKRASAVPRDRARELWERFRQAGDEVRARAEVHFAQEAAERGANLARKEALCQQAEALSESTDWIRTAEAIKQLQIDWKAIAAVPRGHEKVIWERFRAACDRFFTRRREDLVHRKQEWVANLARKEALIAQAEALAETTSDWERAIEQARHLQAEWKSVGAVRKNRSDEVWQRFRAAVDRVFERYQQRDQIQVTANVAAREAICEELEQLAPPAETPSAEPPDGLAERVSELRARWQQAPVLVPRDVLSATTARFTAALRRVATTFPASFGGSDLDLDATRQRAEELCARVEAALPSEAGPPPEATPTEILAARLREALASNTIGGVAVADGGADTRRKAAVSAVREAQAAWSALGPFRPDAADALSERFERACRQVAQAVEKGKK